ncbi:MAG TPA: SURF1 family protein [Acidiferrobacterales bacterium]|jgi:surfeit locus 1 family protein
MPSYRFRPALIPTLATVLLVPVLIGLGAWQTQRAETKRALQAEYDARSTGPVVAIGADPQPAEALRYYRVVARGVYEPGYQILIDNRVHRGHPGYHVITPLKLAGGETRVLVNRGWIAGTPDRRLPVVETPATGVQIEGIAMVPGDRHFTLADPGPVRGEWETLWQNLDMARYAEAVPFSVQPVVVLLDPDSAAGGFVREWARLDAGIATHQSYAFQWFALATALAALYLLVNLKRETSDRDRDD